MSELAEPVLTPEEVVATRERADKAARPLAMLVMLYLIDPAVVERALEGGKRK